MTLTWRHYTAILGNMAVLALYFNPHTGMIEVIEVMAHIKQNTHIPNISMA